LCALGLAAAAPRRDVSRTVMLRGRAFSRDAIERVRGELLAKAGSAQSSEDFLDANAGVRTHARLDARNRTVYELRYRGQSYELPVESDSSDPAARRGEFARAHEQRYGYRDDSGEIELVTIRASVWGAAPRL